MSNIIDKIQLSGVTYDIGGSGGAVSSAITSGDTNAVAGGAVYDKFDEVEQVTAAALNALNTNKQDKLSAGTGISISGNVISATGGGGGNPTVELTQAEYDALVSAGTVSADTYYIITDATPVDMSNYYTTAQTNTLLAEKQNTLVSGTNIKTINNESILGSGNISVEGKGVVGSGSISVSTGTTDYTINFTPSIWAGTGVNSIKENYPNNTASGNYSHVEGYSTKAIVAYSHAEGYYTLASGTISHAEGVSSLASGQGSHAEGNTTRASGQYSHAEGAYTTANNESEHASGKYNVSSSASTTFGDSGNTLFSVGNGTNGNNRHNAFEIRQNGDIYISSGGTDIKLQDHLGGGGSGTVSSAITSGDTNAVAGGAVYDKFDEVEQVTAQALNVLNESLSGKQDTLSAGTNITIVDNVISAEGGSITIDPSLDSGSTNPVANSAITTAINAVSGAVPTQYVKKIVQNSDNGVVRFYDVWKESGYAFHIYNFSINGKMVLSKQNGTYPDVYNFNLVETSAITSAITSSSTDAQVPSAKAVNDKLGGLKLVKLTQSAYDALSPNYDSNTLYVIVN